MADRNLILAKTFARCEREQLRLPSTDTLRQHMMNFSTPLVSGPEAPSLYSYPPASFPDGWSSGGMYLPPVYENPVNKRREMGPYDVTSPSLAELEAVLGRSDGSGLYAQGLDDKENGLSYRLGNSEGHGSLPFSPRLLVDSFKDSDGWKGMEKGPLNIQQKLRAQSTRPEVIFSRYPTCPICPRKFSGRSNLKKHYLSVHLKCRPFRCTRVGCDKTFYERNKLKKHIATVHEDRRAYPCPRCQRGFKQKSDRDRHVSGTHDKIKSFKCTVPGCGRPFSRHGQLKNHYKKVHSIDL